MSINASNEFFDKIKETMFKLIVIAENSNLSVQEIKDVEEAKKVHKVLSMIPKT